MDEQKVDGSMPTKPAVRGELGLWWLSSLFLTGLAIVAMGAAKTMFGWSEAQWLASSVLVVFLSATWGSWAALIWTHSRALRVLMVVAAAIPGGLMLLVGGWMFFQMPENLFVWRWGWAILAVHGVGAVSMVSMIGGRELIEKAPTWLRARRLAVGWTLYPILITTGSVALVAGIFYLMPDLVGGNHARVVSLLRWVIPSQALILLTTGLPALSAQICRRLTRG